MSTRGVIAGIVFMNSPDLIHKYNTADSFYMSSSDSGATTHSKFTCKICGKTFDSLGDMQRHSTVEHIQKGEVPSKSDREQ